MKDIELKVFIWADEMCDGETFYTATAADMSSAGYIKVGEVTIKTSVTEPDFTAVRELEEQRKALIKDQKIQLDALKKKMSEAGQ
jgi:hypothetical protein